MPDYDRTLITDWARSHWPEGDPGDLSWETIPADGSPRRFVRLCCGQDCLVVLHNPENRPENRAWHYLAGHLAARALPVAKVLAADLEQGLFMMQDLGRVSLQQAAQANQEGRQGLAELYQPVLALLARMQAEAGKELDTAICFDGAELTPEFLLQREAGYFLEEFVAGTCGLPERTWPAGLMDDLKDICHLAGLAGPRGFVHRDFQSRNIILQQGRLGLVDFQGGRLGPAQYDLAALLNDPYVDLCWDLRDILLKNYLDISHSLRPFPRELFMAGWPFVALSRAMQILGAFAYLTRKKGRDHFAAYVAPALATLQVQIESPELAPFTALRDLVRSLPGKVPGLDLRPIKKENQP